MDFKRTRAENLYPYEEEITSPMLQFPWDEHFNISDVQNFSEY